MEFIKGTKIIYVDDENSHYDLGKISDSTPVQGNEQCFKVLLSTGMFKGVELTLPESKLLIETKENLMKVYNKYGNK